jgi:excisionase family DNA binding protein
MKLINTDVLMQLIDEKVEEKIQVQLRDINRKFELLVKAQQAKQVLTIEETANYMNLKAETVRNILRTGKLIYYKQNGKVFIKTSDINDYLLQNRKSSIELIAEIARKKSIELSMKKQGKN